SVQVQRVAAFPAQRARRVRGRVVERVLDLGACEVFLQRVADLLGQVEPGPLLVEDAHFQRAALDGRLGAGGRGSRGGRLGRSRRAGREQALDGRQRESERGGALQKLTTRYAVVNDIVLQVPFRIWLRHPLPPLVRIRTASVVRVRKLYTRLSKP